MKRFIKKLMIAETEKLSTKQVNKIRKDFPMLTRKLNGKQLIYLDSAATGQKPKVVIDKLSKYYSEEYAKPQEVHTFSKATTDELEETRKKVASFIHASKPEEVIFTKGCTEGINIVASGFAKSLLNHGDEIIITQLEHHANIIPWQMACESSGATLKVAPITSSGQVDMNALEDMINYRTKIISISHSSHVLGTILPVKQIAEMAHKKGIAVLADGAQAAPHMPVNMQELGCDFYAFSGHKMGSPTGVGVLYGKEKWLNKLPPFIGGGDMTKKVTFEKSSYEDLPMKFEGGTLSFADFIAFGTLIDYVQEIDMDLSSAYEQELLSYATNKLSAIEKVKVYGTAPEKEPVISFDITGGNVKKLEKYLNDEWSIAVRAGDLSAQPLMEVLGVKSLIRASFCYYNTFEEIDTLTDAVKEFIDRH